MRVLLTGSSGWLGRFLAPRLRAAGHVVIGLDVAPGADTCVIGSVADRTLVEGACSGHGIEAIVHAGALHKPDIARVPAQAFIEVNVTGTLNLLQAAVTAGHDRFVFTSTTSLMISQAVRQEASSAAVWLDEGSGPLAPRNIYGVTKLAAEGLCQLHYLEHGLNCVILRTGRFFPEEDDTHRELSGPNLKANEFQPAAHGGGRGRSARRGTRTRARDRVWHVRHLRSDSLRSVRRRGTQARCCGGSDTLLSRCAGALCTAGLATSGQYRAGLRRR